MNNPPTRKVAKPRTKSPRKPKTPKVSEAPVSAVVEATPIAPSTQPVEPQAAVVAPPPPPVLPEVKQEVKPEIKPEVKPEVKPIEPVVAEVQSPSQEDQPPRREFNNNNNRRDRHNRHHHREDRRQQHDHAYRVPNTESHADTKPHAQEMGPQTRGLTLLGAKTTVYSDQYTPAILEVFENRHPENDYFVKFNCPEFTSLCPITGQPDFATIYISYIPDRKMVESKSLKLYLFSFRNHGAFHEDCVNIIMKDLIKLMAPRYIEVWGKFLPRGGLSIDPFANYGRPTTRWEEFARQRLLMHDLSPEIINNR